MSTLPGEFELIARYFAPLARHFPGAYGLLDDAATVTPLPGHELVVKTDAIVGGVHFLDGDPPDLIARKALRVNLSDLAAKGALARAYLLDIMLPTSMTEEWVAAFARGLACDQEEYGVHLIGGDTDSTPGPVTIAIMALGDVRAGQMIRRYGARAGETIFVSGTVGDAALGIEALHGTLPGIDGQARSFLVDRYRLPRPRVTLGPRLVGVASAAIDISDGLIADLRHLCDVSDVSSVIDSSRVPLSSAARTVLERAPERIVTILTGGDDYEILFTAPATAAGELDELSRVLDVPITAIGCVGSRPALQRDRITVLDARGQRFAFDRSGWTHF